MKIVDIIKNNHLTFLKDEWLLKQKIESLSIMLFFTALVLILFVFIRYLSNDYQTALADLVGAISFLTMYQLIKKNKKYYNPISLICAIIITTVISLGAFISEGSVERSIWFFSILIFVYFFRDSKEARWWFLLLISVISFIHFKNETSNNTTYIILIMNMSLMATLLHFYEQIKSREQKHLQDLNETLEDKVLQRTKELDNINNKLEEKVKEEISKNETKDKLIAQQNKMAAMGEMIGNIAHQFRQPLTAISATSSSIKFEIDLGSTSYDEIKTKLTKVESYVKHLSNTIEDFRCFFQEDKEKTTFNLANSIEKDLFLVDASYVSNSIKLIKEYDENITVKQFKNELTQSLLNIFNNAKDVLIQNNIKHKLVFLTIKKENNQAIISIKDNGGGVDESVLSHLFKEKVSTKDHDKGTGIGLYMTRQMIEDHMGGTIQVKNAKYIYNNEYYKGAEFIITLPLV